jgi:hypothetical protein
MRRREMPRGAEKSVAPGRAARRVGVAVASAALIALASCSTLPQRTTGEWVGALPSGATVYASLAVKGSADFIKRILKEAGPGAKDLNALVDRTERMVASFTLVRGGEPQFSVVSLGSYPSAFIGGSLSRNKDWAKKSGPAGSWWELTKAGIQMSIPNDGILLASNGSVEGLLTAWGTPRTLPVPAEVAEDMRRMAFVLYMPELPGGIAENAAKNNVHIPIQDVWLSAEKVPGAYVVYGTANTSSEKEAKLLTLVLRLGIVAWMRSEKVPNASERLKATTVNPEGVQVKIAGLRVGEDELIPLFLSLLKGLAPPEEAADAPVESPQ